MPDKISALSFWCSDLDSNDFDTNLDTCINTIDTSESIIKTNLFCMILFVNLWPSIMLLNQCPGDLKKDKMLKNFEMLQISTKLQDNLFIHWSV